MKEASLNALKSLNNLIWKFDIVDDEDETEEGGKFN